jgi:hypothetical protein
MNDFLKPLLNWVCISDDFQILAESLVAIGPKIWTTG